MKLRTAFVSLLAVALLWWFLGHANLHDVLGQIRGARMDLLVVSLVGVVITYALRAVRWRYLLSPIGPTRFRTALRTTIIGFAASFIFPARAGEVIRPYLLAREEGLSAMSVFATIVLERVLDLITVLALLALVIWSIREPAGGASALLRSIRVSAVVAAAAAAALLAVMMVLASHPERIGTFVARMGRVLPARFAHTVGDFARTFSEGFAVMRAPKPLAIAMIWSFAVWIMIAFQAWLVTRAFGIDMSFAGSFLLQAMLVVGVSVPTPGGIGGFHEAYRLGVTTFFGAQNDAAVGAALVLHAISFVPVTLIGVAIMAHDGLGIGRLQGLAGAIKQEETATSS